MIKQILIIRKDLNMRKGKIGAQCAHASMKVFFDRIHMSLESYEGTAKEYDHYKCKFTNEMIQWMEGSFTKIVVGCSSEQELFDLQKQAEEAGIVNAIILDNGQTEFKMGCQNCNGKGEHIQMYDAIITGTNPISYICNKCHGTGKIPKPTYTCLAIGPDESEKIDKITKELQLL